MGGLSAFPIDAILQRGIVRHGDVLHMRGAYYDDDRTSSEDVERLLAIHRTCEIEDAAWPDFLVEAVCDYIVDQQQPEGYITAANAEWLIRHISQDGKIGTRLELDILLTVLDQARWSPASLIRFALEQVKHAVVSAGGPLREGRAVPAGHITDSEVEMVRRMIYAFGGDGSVPVTRAEAEVLFDINDALGTETFGPAWTDLFVKALANVVMSASGFAVPTREEALRRDAWLDGRNELAPLSMLKSMVSQSLARVIGCYHDQTSEDRALARLERQRIEIITNEQITEGEAAWLTDRLGRDGKLSPNEMALLQYLAQLNVRMHPLIAGLIEQRSRAA